MSPRAKKSNEPTVDELLHTAKTALRAGGRILKDGYTRKRRVFFKSLTSPVTHIDMKSERAIIRLIRRRFPSHGFLAEESSYLKEITGADRKKVATGLRMSNETASDASATSRYRWIIDPLDGTVNFLHGLPQSCVSIGVEKDGVVIAGGVYDPYRDELFLAKRGGGATLNGKRIHVSTRAPLQRSLLVTGFPYDHQKKAGYYLAFLEPFLRKSMDIRRLGAAALDLAWVACGRVEGYWEFSLCPWDLAAGGLLVQEAGGTLSDFSGRSIDVNRPLETLATNGKIHAEMLKEFRRTKTRLKIS